MPRLANPSCASLVVSSAFFDSSHYSDHASMTPQPSGTNTPLTDVSSLPENSDVGGMAETPSIPAGAIHRLSDSEEDIDPDELLTAWLSTKSSLYELSPDHLIKGPAKNRHTGKKTKASNKDNVSSPEVARLVRRLQKIEKDILFDHYEGERRWNDIQISMAQEKGLRDRLQVGNTKRKPQTPATEGLTSSDDPTLLSDKDSASPEPISQIENEEDLLGDLFLRLPESTTNAETGITSMTVEQPEGIRLAIRDFGKWTGLSPRRILEEACRARYNSNSEIGSTTNRPLILH